MKLSCFYFCILKALDEVDYIIDDVTDTAGNGAVCVLADLSFYLSAYVVDDRIANLFGQRHRVVGMDRCLVTAVVGIGFIAAVFAVGRIVAGKMVG